jgi:hypothetical protein
MHNGELFKYMRFVPDERLLKCELELSLLLMDEITNVVAAKQAPALNLISKGLANTWMFMACNPPESAADGQPLTAPFINRIWYGDWEVDEEAQDWGLTHFLEYPAPEIPVVPLDYMKYQQKWGLLVRDYFTYNPKDRNACPKGSEKHSPWPSSRTWNHVTRCLAGVDAVKASNKVRDDVVMGLLGPKTGAAFIKYINNLKLPKPEVVLENAESFESNTRFDINSAILTSVVNYLERHATEAMFERALVLRQRLREQNPEMAMMFSAGLRIAMPTFMQMLDAKSLASV